ncbi:MAG: outer membrane beta-barrel protein [Cyclobacteriaceae bacterium]
MKYWLLSLILIMSTFAYGQEFNLSGRIIDSETSEGLLGASVRLISIKDTTDFKFQSTDLNGDFKFMNISQGFYRLKVSSISFEPFTRVMRVAGDLKIGAIPLSPDTKMLGEVVIEGSAVPVEKKGDTTVYNADAFQTNPDATAADLVSKMPGMSVTEDGVEANGEAIQQVLLDGKRFFGQDPLLALNTVPAEVVNQVEVFDQQSERARLTGFDDGNTTKTMNVITKEEKRNGQFGKLYAGYGTDKRYKLEGNINHMNKGKQLSVLGMSNNVNQRSFTDSNILGTGGSRRGGRRFSNSSGGNSQPSGITKTQSVGLNFSNDWKEKGRLELSYFMDDRNKENEQTSSRETFFERGSQYYDEFSTSFSDNMNHRFNMRMEYNVNKSNSIVFTPRLTLQNNSSLDYTDGKSLNSSQTLINQTLNNYAGDNNGIDFNGSLLLRHKFERSGRSLTANISNQISDSDLEFIYEDLNADSLLQYLTYNTNRTLSTNIGYTEPIGMSSQLQIDYELSSNTRKNELDAFSYDTESINEKLQELGLSSYFNNDYTTHAPSVGFSKRSFQNNFSIRLTYQHANLESEQLFPSEYYVPRSFDNIIPSMFARFNLSEETSVFMRYSANTSMPSASQLQEVIDNSDPLFYSMGNSELNQSYNHRLMGRISKTNIEKNRSLSNFLFASQTNDYITNTTIVARQDTTLQGGIVLQRGAQLSRPTNLDGFWSIRDNTTYSFVLTPLKTNVNTSVGVGYTRIPGMNNNVLNVSETFNVNGRVNFASNISEKVDFNLFYAINGNRVLNSVSSRQNSEYTLQTIGGKVNFILPKNLVIRSDANYQIYQGVSEEFDTQYLLWNVNVAKKFLKDNRGEIGIVIFDLLKQNQSISQNITSAYLEETRSLVLTQYFMGTFTYQIRRFKRK